jgi:hypothetical protein
VQEECTNLGLEVLDVVAVSAGTLDMGPAATRALALNPDGYYSCLIADDNARFCKAIFERGMIEGWRICISGGGMGAAMFSIGKGYLENAYVGDVMDLTSTASMWVDYIDAYAADHDGGFPYTVANYGPLEAMFVFKAAIERLGITGDPAKLADERIKMRDFFWNCTDIPDAQGSTFGYVNGEKNKDFFFYQIKDNKLVFVSSVPTMK